MEHSANLQTVNPVEEKLTSECDTPTSSDGVNNMAELKMETTSQTSKEILQNMTKSMGHEDPKYELFSTVFINHVPNYCLRVSALSLVATGKSWCEQEAIENCARTLINKYKGDEIDSNPRISKEPRKHHKNSVETDMRNLAIDDTATEKDMAPKRSALFSKLEGEEIFPSICDNKPTVTDKSITSAEPEIITKFVKRENEEKSFRKNRNVDTNSNLNSPTGSSVNRKNSASNKPIQTTTYCNSYYVQSSVDYKLLAKIKDSDIGDDPIGKLEDICMKSQIILPRYKFHKPSGSPNGLVFKMQCSLLGYIVYGRGRTKKEAKSQAAANMMRNMIALGWDIKLV